MKGKKIIALALALVLTLTAFPALAAPTRELQSIEINLTEGLRALIEIAAWSTVWDRYALHADSLVLEAGKAPNPGGAERAMYEAARRVSQTTFLSMEEANNLYGQLFTQGEWTVPDSSSPYFTVTGEGISLNDLSVAPGNYGGEGAYLYSASFNGMDAAVRCDLYDISWMAPAEGQASVEEAPEELVSWTYHMEASLRFAPETEFGWTLNSISLSPYYRDGNFGEWWEAENWELEYSVNLPGSFELTDETSDHWVFKNTEGDAVLTIEAKEDDLSYDQALAAFMQDNPGRKVTQERLYDAFTSLVDGEFIMVVTADEYPITYTITLTFPKDRQAEYAFYAEIIRNSFGVWGLSNG
ncbi:MAG: hypothetical protein IKO52_10820 [Clostridia bacterium]|nr:hypothetical protein [Clostridia bacterium]